MFFPLISALFIYIIINNLVVVQVTLENISIWLLVTASAQGFQTPRGGGIRRAADVTEELLISSLRSFAGLFSTSCGREGISMRIILVRTSQEASGRFHNLNTGHARVD
jgi:hypothetical protein